MPFQGSGQDCTRNFIPLHPLNLTAKCCLPSLPTHLRTVGWPADLIVFSFLNAFCFSVVVFQCRIWNFEKRPALLKLMSVFRMLDTARSTLIRCLNISCSTSIPSRWQQQSHTVLRGISDITTNISVTEHNGALLLGQTAPAAVQKLRAVWRQWRKTNVTFQTKSSYRTYSASRFPTGGRSGGDRLLWS